MRMHKQRLLDQQYVRRMTIQVKSKDPTTAEEARRGLALREASIAAESSAFLKDNSLLASRASLTTLLERFVASSLPCCGRRAHIKRVITAGEAELLNGTQAPVDHQQDHDHQPHNQQEQDQRERLLSSLTKCKHATHSECLLARTGHRLNEVSPFQPGVFVPSRIPRQERDKTTNEKREETWGKSYWFEDGQERGLKAGIYQDAPPVIQRALIRKALAPNLIFKFVGWTPFRMKGRGKYRMAADLEDAVITKRLVQCMGEAADIIGGLGPGVMVEGYSDIDFHTLLCTKYSNAMQRQFKSPYKESTDRTRIARGFPQDFMPKMKAAEAFLAPTTFAVYDYMLPNGHITDHRLVFNHFWNGQRIAENNPANYTLEDTVPVSQSDEDLKHDPGNLPFNLRAKFENPAHPSHIKRPPRHSRLQGSDLEALERRDEPPLPEEHVLRAAAVHEAAQKASKAQPRRIANAEPRATNAKKVADKYKRDRNAAALLGNRRRAVTQRQVRVVSNANHQTSSEDDDEDGGVPIDLQRGITGQTSINPGPPPSNFGIARLMARSPQERSASGGIRLPAITNNDTPAGPPKAETPPDVHSDTSSSNDENDEPGKSDRNASPQLRSILVKRPANGNESPKRAPKRSICWDTNIQGRNNHRTTASALQSVLPSSSSRHAQDENNPTSNDSPPPSLTTPGPIRWSATRPRSGAALTTNPNNRASTAMVETTRPQVQDGDLDAAWAQGDAAEYARQLQEDFIMRQRLRDLAQ